MPKLIEYTVEWKCVDIISIVSKNPFFVMLYRKKRYQVFNKSQIQLVSNKYNFFDFYN